MNFSNNGDSSDPVSVISRPEMYKILDQNHVKSWGISKKFLRIFYREQQGPLPQTATQLLARKPLPT